MNVDLIKISLLIPAERDSRVNAQGSGAESESAAE